MLHHKMQLCCLKQLQLLSHCIFHNRRRMTLRQYCSLSYRSWLQYSHQLMLQDWILTFKFGGRQSLSFLLGRFFALSMMGQKTENDYDCTGPIPFQDKRLKSRGFNLSILLTYHLLLNLKRHSFQSKSRLLRRLFATTP